MSSSSTTTEPTVRETPEVSGDDNANARAAVHSAKNPVPPMPQQWPTGNPSVRGSAV